MLINYKEIIESYGLECTIKEFKDYYKNLDLSNLENELNSIDADIYTFDELYNNVKIENPANGKYYYILSIDGKTYLQYASPFASGNVALNDSNIDEVIQLHKQTIIDEILEQKKLEEAIKYFN